MVKDINMTEAFAHATQQMSLTISQSRANTPKSPLIGGEQGRVFM